ncbi:MAG: SIMPL domain-containing protein [Actinomycetota bacterium]
MDEGITVTGFGDASAPADVVRVNVGVQCDGSDVASALREVGQRLEAVSAAARDHGVGDMDIQSSSVSLYPRYGSDGMAIVGYQANHQLDVTSHDVDRVTDLITAFATAAGNALTINRISLSLNDPGPLAEQARKAAFASAQSKAEQFARLSGRALADVVSVAEDTDRSQGWTSYAPMARARAALSSDSGGMGVEGGETTVRATVTVRWSLGARH